MEPFVDLGEDEGEGHINRLASRSHDGDKPMLIVMRHRHAVSGMPIIFPTSFRDTEDATWTLWRLDVSMVVRGICFVRKLSSPLNIKSCSKWILRGMPFVRGNVGHTLYVQRLYTRLADIAL